MQWNERTATIGWTFVPQEHFILNEIVSYNVSTATDYEVKEYQIVFDLEKDDDAEVDDEEEEENPMFCLRGVDYKIGNCR